MKKPLLLFVISFLALGLVSFDFLHSGGETGATGSPGEGTCGGCHSGGTGVTTVSITSIPSFTNNSFDPSTDYTIQVTVSNPSLTMYGFDCEILGQGNTSIGTMTNPGTAVQLANAFNGRRNATHTFKQSGPSGSFTFSFKWISPAIGNATIYAAGNAVNNNSNTGGDLPSTTVLTLTNVNTSVGDHDKTGLSAVQVFPNPASDIVTVSYMLDKSTVITSELLEITGKKVSTLGSSEQNAGPHAHFFDVKAIPPGIYFLKISTGEKVLAQKLISIN